MFSIKEIENNRKRRSARWKGYGQITGQKWSSIKQAAKVRKIDFKLTIKQGWNLFLKQKGLCALTGVPLQFAEYSAEWKHGAGTASLDRIDSSKSYSIDNVQWVHKDINLMKQSFSQEYFLNQCQKVFEYKVLPEFAGINSIQEKELGYRDVYLLPKKSIVSSRDDCDTSVVFGGKTFEMPFYPANMPSVVNTLTCEFFANKKWFYTMHRFGTDNIHFIESMHHKNLFASISVGLNAHTQNSLLKLRDASPEFITIDIANAWCRSIEKIIKLIKKNLPNSFLIVGNVATKEAVIELQNLGADAIKVGIAGGHICITKEKTGFHRPMISTIKECAAVATVPIIADGGIETMGDIAKALSCGATMVMSGMLFSGYEESAGDIVEIDNKKYKKYFGSASGVNRIEKKHIEGKEILVDYKGNMESFLIEAKEDLQSSISYAGGRNLSAFKKCTMIQV